MTDLEIVVLTQLRVHEVASCRRMAQENGSSVEEVNSALLGLQAKGLATLAPTSTKNRRYTAGGAHWMPVAEPAMPAKGRGVYTLHDLMLRCVIDEETGCWAWRGALSNGKTPSLRLPALNATVTLGTAICFLKTGKKPAPGRYWHVTCTTASCANPEHRAEGTRSSQMQSPAVKQKGPLHAARVAAGRRAQSANCDEAKASAIRDSDEPLEVLAVRHGITVSMVSKIRRGLLWNPMPVRQSSVFAGALA